MERLLNLLFERHDIGRLGLDRYLTRWVLWGRRGPDGTRRTGPGGNTKPTKPPASPAAAIEGRILE